MKISVLVATYNRPDALELVLQSLKEQTDKNFEVIVADDTGHRLRQNQRDEYRRSIRKIINGELPAPNDQGEPHKRWQIHCAEIQRQKQGPEGYFVPEQIHIRVNNPQPKAQNLFLIENLKIVRKRR